MTTATSSRNGKPQAMYLLRRAARRLRISGPLAMLRRAGFLAYEAYREWRLGIDTTGFIPWDQLGADPASVDYDPIGYLTLDRALRYLNVNSDDVFLDYGCGKGRVLARAAQLPFRRVTGVEMSAGLCRAARENLVRAKPRFRCDDVSVVRADAKHFVVPGDVSVVFLFNPFTGHILTTVLENLRQSLVRRPRELTVLYVLPITATDIFAPCPWMQRQHQRLSQGLKLVVYKSNPDPFTEESACRLK